MIRSNPKTDNAHILYLNQKIDLLQKINASKSGAS